MMERWDHQDRQMYAAVRASMLAYGNGKLSPVFDSFAGGSIPLLVREAAGPGMRAGGRRSLWGRRWLCSS
jgi:hypothetical protein